jgi:CMP-N,N'-diacetyllegionaminic acid synthase
MSRVIGLIPARGGSKGIPRKNLQLLNQQPLINYTISAAQRSGVCDQVVVSSDDDETLQFARKLAVIDHRRRAELSHDLTPMDPVIADVIAARQCHAADVIILLQPTSPLRTSSHIHAAYQQFLREKPRLLLSVYPVPNKILKSYVVQDATLQPLWKSGAAHARRQDLPAVYMPNGAIYIFTVDEFYIAQGIPRSGLSPFVMNETDSIDIDVADDLRICEKIMSNRH